MQFDSACKHAVDLLYRVSTAQGFVASPVQEDNYCRVWTRDAVICGLAAMASGEERLIETFKASLKTIWQHQHLTGFLPSNVDTLNKTTSYGNSVGRVDTACWGIIGLCIYTLHTGKKDLADECGGKLEKAFQLMDAWEFNGRNLIYVPQSGDWADEYLQHGYILYDNLLRIWALESAAKVYNIEGYASKAKTIRELIQNNFFYRSDNDSWYSATLPHQKETAPRNFWWLGFNPARVYSQFDLQANALALLLNIGNKDQKTLLIHHISAELGGKQQMLPSFSPVITTADWEMHELENNFAFRFRNKPHEFHNGGLWPVWNGWMAMALQLQKEETISAQLRNNIAVTISNDDFELNECYQGQTNKACGVKQCAWSAAGVVLAEKGARLFPVF